MNVDSSIMMGASLHDKEAAGSFGISFINAANIYSGKYNEAENFDS